MSLSPYQEIYTRMTKEQLIEELLKRDEDTLMEYLTYEAKKARLMNYLTTKK
jgi:hypothetical protein